MMKIAICGSMTFAKRMLEVSKVLEDMGNKAILSVDTIEALKDPPLGLNVEFCIEGDIIKDHLKNWKKMTQFWFLIMKKMGFLATWVVSFNRNGIYTLSQQKNLSS